MCGPCEALAANAALDDVRAASSWSRAACGRIARGCSRAALADEGAALGAVPRLGQGDLEAWLERLIRDLERLNVVVQQRLDTWSRPQATSTVPGVEVLLSNAVTASLKDQGVRLHDPGDAVVGDLDQLAS